MRRVLALWWLVLSISTATSVWVLVSTPILDLKITRAQRDMRALETALTRYKSRHGDFPSQSMGLSALGGEFSGSSAADPWGNQYVYRRATTTGPYLLYSRGLDGRDDRGNGDDVTTWPKRYRCKDYGVNCP